MPRGRRKNIQEYSIRINSEPQSLERVRSFIIELLTESAFSEEEMSIIELVTYEACANSIEHAHKNVPDFYVDLLLQICGKNIIISITDSGKEFAPAEIPDIDISEKIAHQAGRGMGLPLIKALMDEVSFERTPDQRNRITMKKDFSKAKAKRQLGDRR
jgi:anti-sigma regulatory factor (Ser/Thr protein kinase)